MDVNEELKFFLCFFFCFCEIKKKNIYIFYLFIIIFFFWGGGGGRVGVRVDVNREVKFL